jgi:exodeoxyribonuclease V alpha subunit
VTDPFHARVALAACGVLRAFNDAGVLNAADVHVASLIGRLADVADEDVLLAAALAVRGPRLGHVCTDLATIAGTASVDADAGPLSWPAPADWLRRVAASPAVAVGDDDPAFRPLRLVGSRLYLDRYWSEERQVAADLLARAGDMPVDAARLATALDRLFGTEPSGQRAAAAAALTHRFTVIAGGPGTGKTTTVARLLALAVDLAGPEPPLIALAAPTGKAAARLEEAVHAEAEALPVDDRTRQLLRSATASTVHRLLGRRPDSRRRFRHDRANPLAHDLVVVDETSMVSLPLMARLVEAVRRDARLVLVGDPHQLASVEAGAVLGDLVGWRDGVVELRQVFRFGGHIAALAEAIRAGDADATVDVLRRGGDDVHWVSDPDEIRGSAVAAGRAMLDAARAGDADSALAAMASFRLLCAHRRGPDGVSSWTGRIERWLSDTVDGLGATGPWYAGRPLLVTANDHALRLSNGDTGVVVALGDGRLGAAFPRGDTVALLSPTRLAAVDTVHAMTIHKAQGSQFDTVAVVLPGPESPILTRELLYTAVTRARRRVLLSGSEAAVRRAVLRPVARSSGLRDRLWA